MYLMFFLAEILFVSKNFSEHFFKWEGGTEDFHERTKPMRVPFYFIFELGGGGLGCFYKLDFKSL